jgi:hypothetical protein
MLYPKGSLAWLLREHPDYAADVFALLGEVTGHELRGEGRVYGGGLNKIEPSELARISASAFTDRWPELRRAVHRQGELFDGVVHLRSSEKQPTVIVEERNQETQSGLTG